MFTVDCMYATAMPRKATTAMAKKHKQTAVGCSARQNVVMNGRNCRKHDSFLCNWHNHITLQF